LLYAPFELHTKWRKVSQMALHGHVQGTLKVSGVGFRTLSTLCLCLACALLVPGLCLACAWLAPGLRLACSQTDYSPHSC
jgi:hypothetical protein